jgi:hypothetical protein
VPTPSAQPGSLKPGPRPGLREAQPSGREAKYRNEDSCKLAGNRAERQKTLKNGKRVFSMNLVAADIRRLHLKFVK